MKLETFFEKFDQFADAPDAVAAMRKLVFQLAMQGKLVGQIRADGDAVRLLAVISRERDHRATKLRIPEVPKSTDANGHAFPIPANWAWTQLANIALQIQYGYTASADPNATEIRMLRITDIQDNRVDWPTVPGCQIEHNEAEKYLLNPNDILIARTGGTIGKSFIVPDAPVKSVFASYLIRITPPQSMAARYLKAFMESPLYWTQLRQMSAGTGQPNVNGQALGRLEIPLPPFAEQKRIVAKVEELMALCDRLEAQQQERETRHTALARASLARFADAPTPANLNFIFHKSYDITPADLLKSILTLAVQGKLVPQVPADEPATQQLKSIQARKAELVRNQVIKQSEPSRPVVQEELDHDVPESWAWVRLVEICELITDGTHQTPKYTEFGRIFLSAQNVKPFRFMPAKHRFVSEEHYQGYVKNRKPEKGDVLLTRVGAGIGEAATIDQDLNFAIYVSLGLIRPMRGFVFSDYITLWLNSPDGTDKSSRNTYGKGVSQGNLNLSLIRNFLVPLPPLAEQRRIVAKVEQLMALVAALETQIAESRATAANLLSAIVAELTGTPSARKVSAQSGSTTGRRGRPPKSP